MPNHYTTRLTISGGQDAIEAFKQKHFPIVNGDNDELNFDFNTVIPKPAIVDNTVSGSVSDDGLIVMGHKDGSKYFDYPWVKEAGVTDIAGLRKLLLERSPQCIAEAQRCIQCFDETGHYNWHSWSNANWGTKWNSYNFRDGYEAP